MVFALQGRADEAPHLGVVLDHQHQRSIARALVLRGGAVRRHEFRDHALGADIALGVVDGRRRCDHVRAVRRPQRKLDLEQRAAARRVADADRAPVQFDELLGDRQAEADTAESPRGAVLRLAEALEDDPPHVRRHAGPAVLHAQHGAAFADARQRAVNPPAGGRELERIRQQVQQHPLELFRIDLGSERLGRRHHVGDRALRHQRMELVGDRADEFRQVDPRIPGFELSRVEPRQVEKVVHVLEQGRRVAVHDLQLASLRIGEVVGGQQLLGRAEDQRQRRAQLVADVGEQIALELVELPDSVEQALQLGVLARHLRLDLLLGRDVAAFGEQEDDRAAVIPHRQQREVDEDRLVAGRLAVDLHVAADEFPAAGPADVVALRLRGLARDLEPARLPERLALDVFEADAGPLQRGAIDLERVAVAVEQADELVHLVEHDARELLAPRLLVVDGRDRDAADLLRRAPIRAGSIQGRCPDVPTLRRRSLAGRVPDARSGMGIEPDRRAPAKLSAPGPSH